MIQVPVTADDGERKLAQLPGTLLLQLERFVWANPVGPKQTVRVTPAGPGRYEFTIEDLHG